MLNEIKLLEGEVITMLSSGSERSLALTESGRVFGWGRMFWKELEYELSQNINEPFIIEMNDIKIKKIICGKQYCLFLSYDGDIYAFGVNEYGEVGNGNREKHKLPVKLNHEKKFTDIASHPSHNISMSLSSDGEYYVWGECFKGLKKLIVLTPEKSKFKSFHEMFNNYCKTSFKKFDGLIEFEDSYIRNGHFLKEYREIEKIGEGAYGIVFKAKPNRFNIKDFVAVKRIDIEFKDKKEIINEYLNFSVLNRISNRGLDNLVFHMDAWLEEISMQESKLSLYIEMDLCAKTLEEVIDEIESDSNLKFNGILTELGYFITSQLFLEIVDSLSYLHEQKPPIIHRDLKPESILLTIYLGTNRFVRIADFGIMTFHKSSGDTHTADKGTPKYTAPELIISGDYDTKADIYSLGVVFNNMFDFPLEE
jgi:hypothetical protein